MRSEKIECPYSAEVINHIDNGSGYWKSLTIGIFQKVGDIKTQIGQYDRNYSSMYNTFFPFYQDGEWYALYSKDYTATRIMKLPSCEDLCGEERDGSGFCPVDFFVPYNDETLLECDPVAAETMGFVAGCVWGDDSSWKIQFLDLSNIKNGIFKNEPRFGYIEMPPNLSLKETISFGGWSYFPNTDPSDKYYKQMTDKSDRRITINTYNTYTLDGEKQTTSDAEYTLLDEIDKLKGVICDYVYKLGQKPTYKQLLTNSQLKYLKMPTTEHELFFQQMIDELSTKYNRTELLKAIGINYDLQAGFIYCFYRDWSPLDKKINDLFQVLMGTKKPDKLKGFLKIKEVDNKKEYYIEEDNFWTKNKSYKLISFDSRTDSKLLDWKDGTKIETNGFINSDGTFFAYWTQQDYGK